MDKDEQAALSGAADAIRKTADAVDLSARQAVAAGYDHETNWLLSDTAATMFALADKLLDAAKLD